MTTVSISRSAHARSLAVEDAELVVWWGSGVDCASAIARLHRDGQLSTPDERLRDAASREGFTTP